MKYEEIKKNKRLTDFEDLKEFIIDNQTKSIKIKRKKNNDVQNSIHEV